MPCSICVNILCCFILGFENIVPYPFMSPSKSSPLVIPVLISKPLNFVTVVVFVRVGWATKTTTTVETPTPKLCVVSSTICPTMLTSITNRQGKNAYTLKRASHAPSQTHKDTIIVATFSLSQPSLPLPTTINRFPALDRDHWPQ